eukprot:CAMPEP_0185696642 /NCGR_PEP_ID=MMETSP1164-20130828/5261_1 /TAXON_ID=1104430 /ORGANISM="Chrysoreinhardia sp, Strain CCMP2950" /LENGTH=30 /DNA_ID= /DNA_START= /DNA_END= /DNA_ORIENTATION=
MAESAQVATETTPPPGAEEGASETDHGPYR